MDAGDLSMGVGGTAPAARMLLVTYADGGVRCWHSWGAWRWFWPKWIRAVAWEERRRDPPLAIHFCLPNLKFLPRPSAPRWAALGGRGEGQPPPRWELLALEGEGGGSRPSPPPPARDERCQAPGTRVSPPAARRRDVSGLMGHFLGHATNF